MAAIDTPAETRCCMRCGRVLKSAEAVTRGFGGGCWRKVRKAAAEADLSAWTPAQVEDARQAVEDGAVVPSNREGVFHVVSVDGTEVHLTAAHGCNCTSGLRTLPPRPCWHRCAVAIVLAASARAAVTPAPASAPLALPAAAPADDVWAELEALGALAGAGAPF